MLPSWWPRSWPGGRPLGPAGEQQAHSEFWTATGRAREGARKAALSNVLPPGRRRRRAAGLGSWPGRGLAIHGLVGGSQAVWGARGSAFGFDCGRALPSPGSRHPSRAAVPALLVGPQEAGHLGAQQFDEGARKHLLGLLGCVLEVVLGVRQHVEEGLDQLLVLQDTARPGVRGLGPGWVGGPLATRLCNARGPEGAWGVSAGIQLGWLVGFRALQALPCRVMQF